MTTTTTFESLFIPYKYSTKYIDKLGHNIGVYYFEEYKECGAIVSVHNIRCGALFARDWDHMKSKIVKRYDYYVYLSTILQHRTMKCLDCQGEPYDNSEDHVKANHPYIKSITKSANKDG